MHSHNLHNSWHPIFHKTFEHRVEIDLSKNRKCLVNVEAFIGNTIGSDSELDWIFIDSRRRENFWDRPIQDRTMEHLKPKIPNIKDFIIATTTRLQSGYKNIVSTCVCVWGPFISSPKVSCGLPPRHLSEGKPSKRETRFVKYCHYLESLFSFKHQILIFEHWKYGTSGAISTPQKVIYI